MIDLVLGLLERGDVSPDKSAAILQRLLPPAELGELQVCAAAASGTCAQAGLPTLRRPRAPAPVPAQPRRAACRGRLARGWGGAA